MSLKGKARRRKYKQVNSEKVIARSLARKIPKAKCSVDGCFEMGHKHHEDYSKPLEILYFWA